MAIQGKVVIKGIPLTVRRLRALGEETRKELRELMKKTSTKVRARARDKAAVDTGALRKSITKRVTRKGLGARVGSKLPYAHVVELGAPKRGREADPYLFPALAEEEPEFSREVIRILDKKAPVKASRAP